MTLLLQRGAAASPASPRPAAPAPRYRADIDGLRAVAVFAVMLTHAGVRGFSGGFVGVDVFFVISGYLIYGDLIRRLSQGRLSVLGFYGRRMRRTLPALFVVCAASLLAGCLWLMPGDLDRFARSVVATVLLVPNLFFFSETGYFDAAAASKPLLHTWSLGVEEQFYLLAPLLAVALARFGRRRRGVLLGAMFLAALAGAILMRMASAEAAFYLMPARIFEFLVGACLAEGLLPVAGPRWMAEAVTAAAAAALAFAIATFSIATPHPGVATLIPCLATAAIIHVGGRRTTLVGRILGLRGPAFLGLISYSLYLWHWPILVFARERDVPQTLLWLLGELGLVLALSVLSWRFVERPFRDPASRWRAAAPVLVPGAGIALVASAVGIVALHGLPGRFPPDVASVATYYAYRDQRPFREGQCFITSKNTLADFDRGVCLSLSPREPNVLLIGDSHAAHLWTGLRDTWPGVNVLQATASGCKPVLGTTGPHRCTALMADMLGTFIPAHHLDAVVFGGLWDADDIAPLLRTIAAVKPHVDRVVVFGPAPRYDEPLATLLAKSLERGTLARVPGHLLSSVPALDRAMRAAVSPVATYVSTYDAMCQAGSCRLFAAAGVPMQFDYHHLTAQGVDVLMATVKQRHPDLFPPVR